MKEFSILKSITLRDTPSVDKLLKDISRIPMLSTEEEVELARLAREGDEKARLRLVEANLRFVVSVAKQYQNGGMDLADLISEGVEGMMRAAEKFDETRGFKFISYAVWWIRQSILQALAEEGRMVRLPLNLQGLKRRVMQFIAEHEQREDRQPSITEIAEACDTEEAKVAIVLSSLGRPASIDATLGEDSDTTMSDLMPASDSEADAETDREDLHYEVHELLSILTDRERIIVMANFGIGQKELSLDEIATNLGLTRERVRQLRESAILKLRHNDKRNILKKYL